MLINKKNVFPILGVAFMIITLSGTILEILIRGEMNPQQYNTISIFLFCLVGIGILSQHYRLNHLSPLVMMILQYLIALALIMLYVWLTGFWEPVHPDGYRDMAISFTVVYLIGAAVYYINLRKTIRQQNKDLELIKRLSREQNK